LFDGNLVSLAEFDGLTSPGDIDFDRAAFWVRMYNLLLACMGKGVGLKMAASVGKVEEVDISNGKVGWGEFLRVKIVLDLTKPLARRRLLHIPNRSIWIPFKYEKLPRFYFKCGVVKHGQLGCNKVGSRRPNGGEEEYPYGNWLKVSFVAQGGVGPYTRFGRSWEEQEGEVRHPTLGGVQRFSDEGGSASFDSEGAAGEGNPSLLFWKIPDFAQGFIANSYAPNFWNCYGNEEDCESPGGTEMNCWEYVSIW